MQRQDELPSIHPISVERHGELSQCNSVSVGEEYIGACIRMVGRSGEWSNSYWLAASLKFI